MGPVQIKSTILSAVLCRGVLVKKKIKKIKRNSVSH